MQYLKHQLPSAGTSEVVLKDLLELNLALPKDSKKTAELLKESRMKILESLKKSGFTAKMSQNKLHSRGIISRYNLPVLIQNEITDELIQSEFCFSSLLNQ